MPLAAERQLEWTEGRKTRNTISAVMWVKSNKDLNQAETLGMEKQNRVEPYVRDRIIRTGMERFRRMEKEVSDTVNESAMQRENSSRGKIQLPSLKKNQGTALSPGDIKHFFHQSHNTESRI